MNFHKLLLACLLLTLSCMAVAGDPVAGKAKSMICAACHGANGISPNDIWPSLAAQKEGYLIKQITAFRDGTRVDPMMAPMVKTLSDTDIKNLAAFYASLKP